MSTQKRDSNYAKMNLITKIFNINKAGTCILLFIFSLNLNASVSTATIDSAKAAYSKADFKKAITLYERITEQGMEAPEVYFNLGNAYYKTNAIGLAILNYERAKKLNPDDEDIKFNLKLANQKIEDKIDAAPQLFLTEWKNGIVYLMDEKGWSILCISFTAIALVLFAVYFASYRSGLKQLGFFGGVILIISAVIVFFIAQHSYNLSKNSSDAIILSPSVTVVGSPDEKGTKLFILHEGTKVSITQDEDDWMEIKIANGNIGWVKKQNLVAI
jgi:tetratricopeptide (TPR) repeat protein